MNEQLMIFLNKPEKCCNKKNNNSSKSANNVIRILPSNNRPVPQYKKWVPKNDRTLPTTEFDNNLPIENSPFIDNNEYLYYNTYCQDNKTIINNWKYSRVHGNSKKIVASLNPIKHWRYQLIPRQLYYIDELTNEELDKELVPININTYRNNHNNAKIKYLMDYPGCGTIINIEYLSSLNKEGKKLSNQIQCLSDLVLKNLETEKNCKKLSIENDEEGINCNSKIITSQINYSYNPNFYKVSKSYLESRVKLFQQNNKFINLKFIKNSYVPFWVDISNDYENSKKKIISQHLINTPNNCNILVNCPCYKEVIFNPLNREFTTNSSVSSSNFILKKKRNILTKNRYNINNNWGQFNDKIPIKSLPTPCCKVNQNFFT